MYILRSFVFIYLLQLRFPPRKRRSVLAVVALILRVQYI
jgi:hypothetical protein